MEAACPWALPLPFTTMLSHKGDGDYSALIYKKIVHNLTSDVQRLVPESDLVSYFLIERILRNK